MAFYVQKKEEVYASLTVYRELAYYITRREEYQTALKYFNKALSINPTDPRALIGRSHARSKVCQYEGALEDIAKILKQDPEDLIAIAQKALNTYLCGEVEKALVLNHRMAPIRRKPDHFSMGAMQCYEAIENSVGQRAGRPLRDHFKIIRRLAWKLARDAEKPFEPKSRNKKRKKKPAPTKKTVRELVVPASRNIFSKTKPDRRKRVEPEETEASRLVSKIELKSEDLDTESAFLALTDDKLVIQHEDFCIFDSLHSMKAEDSYVPKLSKPFLFSPMQRYTSNIENYMAEKYLDSMYLDKVFLKRLKENVGIASPNRAGTNKIKQLSREGYKTLALKQELLRTRRPFYYIKYQEAKLSGVLRDRMNAELEKLQTIAKREAETLLVKIVTAVKQQDTKIALATAEKLKTLCDITTKTVLPTKVAYLEEMYKLVSRAYYQLFRINNKQFPWDREKRVLKFLGFPYSKEPSTDSVIDQFKHEFVDRAKQINICEERLRKATSPNEMAWIYHDLTRHHEALKQFELARVYARKCILEGRTANNIYWSINAIMRVARMNVLQNNRNDAKSELNEALRVAKQIDDTTFKEYIETCLRVLEKMEMEDYSGDKVLRDRENQIIRMISSGAVKSEVAHLFKTMNVIPTSRRMSIMPGVRLEVDDEKETASSRRMSIKPTAKQPEDALPLPRRTSAVSKRQTNELMGVKGIAFMELIKYHVD